MKDAIIISYSTNNSKPGEILSINSYATSYLGYKKKDIIGKKVSVLMPSIIVDGHNTLIESKIMSPSLYLNTKNIISYVRCNDSTLICAKIDLLFSEHLELNGSILGIVFIQPIDMIFDAGNFQIITDYPKLSCICNLDNKCEGFTREFCRQFNVKFLEDETSDPFAIFPPLSTLSFNDPKILEFTNKNITKRFYSIKREQFLQGKQVGIIYEMIEASEQNASLLMDKNYTELKENSQKSIQFIPEISTSCSELNISKSRTLNAYQAGVVHDCLTTAIITIFQILKIGIIIWLCIYCLVKYIMAQNSFDRFCYILHQYEQTEFISITLLWVTLYNRNDYFLDMVNEGCHLSTNYTAYYEKFITKIDDKAADVNELYVLANYICGFRDSNFTINYLNSTNHLVDIAQSQSALNSRITNSIEDISIVTTKLINSPLIAALSVIVILLYAAVISLDIRNMLLLRNAIKLMLDTQLPKLQLRTTQMQYQKFTNVDIFFKSINYIKFIKEELAILKNCTEVTSNENNDLSAQSNSTNNKPNVCIVDDATPCEDIDNQLKVVGPFEIHGFKTVICKTMSVVLIGFFIASTIMINSIVSKNKLISIIKYYQSIQMRQINIEMIALLVYSIDKKLISHSVDEFLNNLYQTALKTEDTINALHSKNNAYLSKTINELDVLNSDKFCAHLNMTGCIGFMESFPSYGLRNNIQRFLSLFYSKYLRYISYNDTEFDSLFDDSGI